MTVPDRRLLTNHLIQMLETSTGKPIGDHTAPPSASGYPYGVVFAIPGGTFSGPPFGAPEADAEFVYQVDSIGLTRDQCEWMADRIRRTMVARTGSGALQVPFTDPPGLTVNQRRLEAGSGAPTPEGQPPNQVFTNSERFVLSVTPA